MGDWLPSHNTDTPEDGAIIDQSYYFEKAETAFREEDYERALAYYSRALQYDINLEDAWLGQLRCLIELNEFQEALIWSNRAMERFPNGSTIMAARAVAECRMGNHAHAISYSDGAFSAKGSSPYLWVARGEVLIQLNLENAKACFTKAVEASPSDWAVRVWIAKAYIMRRKHHQALEHLRSAIRIEPENFICWYWTGVCLEALGDITEAEKAYGRAIASRSAFKAARDAIHRIKDRGVFRKLTDGWKRFFKGQPAREV